MGPQTFLDDTPPPGRLYLSQTWKCQLGQHKVGLKQRQAAVNIISTLLGTSAVDREEQQFRELINHNSAPSYSIAHQHF